MSALSAVVYREAKIRATNFTFIFWDLFFPLLYMLVFGVGVNSALGAPAGIGNVSYNEFFLAGILAMASFAIASNTSWSFFLDRDNGIFFEMLTYPMSRSEYLLLEKSSSTFSLPSCRPLSPLPWAACSWASACTGRNYRCSWLEWPLAPPAGFSSTPFSR